MKKCPYCAEEIQETAVKCKHCGERLMETPRAAGAGGTGGAGGAGDTLSGAATVFGGQLYQGKVLAGQYQILGNEPLGSGGMGEVWKALDNELQVTVAIKLLPPALARDKAALENLRREALIGMQLTHPHICRLYGLHTEGELRFIVMEYVDGRTLAQYLASRPERKLTWEELRPLAEQLAGALDYAHGVSYADSAGRPVKGVLHRDIKPQNIMITATGQAKLMDFGIAREIHDTMTQVTGRTSQTPLYASPEQFRGGKMTAASDLYSFAAVLYEALAGRPVVMPHGDLSYQIMHKEYEPLAQATAAVNGLLAAGLEKDAAGRPASAAALLELDKPRPGAMAQRPESAAPAPQDAAMKATGVPPAAGAKPPSKTRKRGRWVLAAVLPVMILLGAAITEMAIANRNSQGAANSARAAAETDRNQALSAGAVQDAPGAWSTADALRSAAQSHLEAGRYPQAREAYAQAAQGYLNATAQARKVAGTRTAAITARDGAAARGKEAEQADAPQAAPELWQKGKDLEGQAKTQFDGGKYEEAKDLYEQAAKRYEDAAALAQKTAAEQKDAQAAREGAAARGKEAELANAAQDAPEPWQKGKEQEGQGKTQFDGRKYLEAKASYEQAAKAYQEATALALKTSTERTAAHTARDTANDRAKLAQQANADKDAPALWQQAQTLAAQAKEHLDAGRFPQAKEAYDQAAAKYQEAAVEADLIGRAMMKAMTAQHEAEQYEDAAKNAQAEQFAPATWSQAQALFQQAATAFTGHDYAGAADNWQKARDAFSKAHDEAVAARQKAIAALLATAKANDSKEKGKAALDALVQLLRLDPQNSEALALQKKIAGYYPLPLEAPFTAQAAKEAQAAWLNSVAPQPSTNSLGMKLALIPAGTFTMGTPLAEAGHLADEGPQHKVTLTKAIFMGMHHVTVGQFGQFVAADGYKTDAEKGGGAFIWDGTKDTKDAGSSWKKNAGFAQGNDHPVVCVSWNDAQAFCQWLSKKEGKTYRLPTEAEWEYACRAGTTTAYPWGNNPTDGKGWANCADRTFQAGHPKLPTFDWDDGFVCTSPVGTFKANAFGLYDMIGNAWQWCGDVYTDTYPAKDQTDPTGSILGTKMVVRGGSWCSGPDYARSGFRDYYQPDYRGDGVGFRVVLECK